MKYTKVVIYTTNGPQTPNGWYVDRATFPSETMIKVQENSYRRLLYPWLSAVEMNFIVKAGVAVVCGSTKTT